VYLPQTTLRPVGVGRQWTLTAGCAIGSAVAAIAGNCFPKPKLFSAQTMQSLFYQKLVATSDVRMTATLEQVKEHDAKRFHANPHSIGSATEEEPDLLEMPQHRATEDTMSFASCSSLARSFQMHHECSPLLRGLPFSFCSLDHNRYISPDELLLVMGVLHSDTGLPWTYCVAELETLGGVSL
jgi:hypothetical protein